MLIKKTPPPGGKGKSLESLIEKKRSDHGFVILNVGAGRPSLLESPFIDCDIAEQSNCSIISPMHNIPLTDNSVEFIFALHVVEHVRPALLCVALKEWRRILKDGGALLIETPDIQRVLRTLALRSGSIFRVPKKFVPGSSHTGVSWIFGMLYGHLNQEAVFQEEVSGGHLPNIHRWLYSRSSIADLLFDNDFTNIKTYHRGRHFFDLMTLAEKPGNKLVGVEQCWRWWDAHLNTKLKINGFPRLVRSQLEYALAVMTGWSRYGKSKEAGMTW